MYQWSFLFPISISFVFYLGNLDCPLIVWESVEINKASYVFKIDYKNYGIEKVMRTIETFLLLEEAHKRTKLRIFNSNLIEGVSSIHLIRHDNLSKIDLNWVRSIESKFY